MKMIMGSVLMLAAVGTLAACGNDDDEKLTPGDPNIVAYEVEYEVEMSSAVYNYFDVTMTYTDENGEEKSRVITGDQDMKLRVPVDKLKDSYTMKVTGVAKQPYPAIDPAGKYRIEYDVEASIEALDKRGESYSIGSKDVSKSAMTIGGDKMEAYLSSTLTTPKSFGTVTARK